MGNGRQAEAQAEGAQEPIQSLLSGVVSGVDRSKNIGPGHAYERRALLHAHGADDLAEGPLHRHSLVDCGKQELAGERDVSQVFGEPDIPVLTSACQEGLAEDEAAYESTTHTMMEAPVELVPAVRELLAKRRAS